MYAFGGIAPDAVSYSLLAGYGDAHAKYLLDIDPQYGQVQSAALPLLINESGRLVYFGDSMEYALNAYVKTYFGDSMEYILGLIVEAAFDSSGSINAPVGVNVEYGVAAGSTGSGTTLFGYERLLDVITASSAAGISQALANLTTEATVASTATIGVTFIFDGAEYDVWVFNAETFAASRYTNYDFNSFAAYQGRYYGANSQGLYELTGATDAGVNIPASIMFGRMNFGTSRLKRVLRAYLGGTSDGKMVLRVVGDNGALRTYKTNVALSDPVRYKRVDPARGLTAHYWQFEITNEFGQDFALDSLDLYPVVLQRRVK